MKIKPLTHKMKNLVREHGNDWNVLLVAHSGSEQMFLVTPVIPKKPDEPYCVWVHEGIDIEFDAMTKEE